jgi:hypothetical protein
MELLPVEDKVSQLPVRTIDQKLEAFQKMFLPNISIS